MIPIEFLKAQPYFAGLNSEELAVIGKFMVEKTYGKGEAVILEGDRDAAAFFVVSGVLKYFKTSDEGKELIIRIVLPGDTFNDVAILDKGPNPASAEAMSPVLLYVIPANEMEKILKLYPRVIANLAGIIAIRARHLFDLVEDLSFRRVLGRIAKILTGYLGDGASPGPKLTQQEMAAVAGTSREVVGRSLKALQDKGIIRMERHRIVISDSEALKQEVHSIN